MVTYVDGDRKESTKQHIMTHKFFVRYKTGGCPLHTCSARLKASAAILLLRKGHCSMVTQVFCPAGGLLGLQHTYRGDPYYERVVYYQ